MLRWLRVALYRGFIIDYHHSDWPLFLCTMVVKEKNPLLPRIKVVDLVAAGECWHPFGDSWYLIVLTALIWGVIVCTVLFQKLPAIASLQRCFVFQHDGISFHHAESTLLVGFAKTHWSVQCEQ